MSEQPSKRRLRERLLAWYRREGRSLPWRKLRDPYAIWLSEIMAQQTRIDVVVGYWTRFLERFPTVESLAEAPPDEVLKLWEGLGYYSRARNLHACAREVVRRLGGRFPREAEALAALPGIGPYTAGAVASIAFDRPAIAVDGNVSRVLARIFAVAEPVNGGPGKARIRALAEELLSPASPGDWTQALMELGALVCLPRRPRCASCPVEALCIARATERTEELPVKGPRKPAPTRHELWIVLRRGDALLMERRPDQGLLAGLWQLPADEIDGDGAELAAAADRLANRLGFALRCGAPLGRIRHVYSHFRLEVHLHDATGRGRLRRTDALRWIRPSALETITVHGATRRALELLDFVPHAPKAQ